MSSGESRLEDSVFDLNADDEEGIKKKKASYHWDRRKKKYIKLNAGDEAVNKGSRMVVSQCNMRLFKLLLVLNFSGHDSTPPFSPERRKERNWS